MKKKEKNYLDIFGESWFPKRHIIMNTKEFFRRCKYARQRAVRGYSDKDLVDLDRFLTHLMEEAIKDFNESKNSYPDRYKVGEEMHYGFQDWTDTLNQVVTDLHYVNTGHKSRYTEEYLSKSKSGKCSEEELNEIRTKLNNDTECIRGTINRRLNRAMSTLNDIMFDLWL